MKNTYILCLIFFIFGAIIVKAQPDLPGKGEVFVDSIVPRVDIFIDPDTLEWIYDWENLESYQEFHAIFVFNNGNIQDTIENIGFRLRGNTSRFSAKKSFKVSFNTFDPGRKWHGLEKLNLNGEHNDPSITRAKICWDMLNDFNIPGARSNHVELYINNNYHGLYINVEHIDEEFVKSRFGNNDGNLYKCLYPADLDYLGSNPDNYKLTPSWGERRIYDLKTNTAADDYSDLAHFIDVLNNTPDANFVCELEKVFNIQSYLKIIAFDIFTSNWDGYIYNKNNFYLYHNTKTNKFEYINYDVDNTFGITWFDVNWGTRNIYNWNDGDRPLYTRVMDNPTLRDQFSYYMDEFMSKVVSDELIENINTMKLRNSPFVANDPFYPLDYGFTHEDYLDSFDEAFGLHLDYGIFPFITTRKTTAIIQLDNYSQVPVINYIRNNYPQQDEDLKIKAFVDAAGDDPVVKLLYANSTFPVQEIQMFDDGEHADKDAGDQIYGAIIPSIQMNTIILYQILVENQNGNTSILPCEPNVYELYESENPQLWINEFMASNTTTIADEFGEYDDWIEIYNGDDEPVWLGDKYLTDNYNNQNKWQMPDYTMEAGEFLLFWADNDPEQGEFHTNFKIDASGEELAIVDNETTGFFIIDSITYGSQTTDVSKGRKPDGDDNWIFFWNTTPGYSNLLGATNDLKYATPSFSIFPNPASGDYIYFDQSLSFSLFSVEGQFILKQENTQSLKLTGLKKGIYIIRTDNGKAARFIKR